MESGFLRSWIKHNCGLEAELQMLVPDASFRRYYRVNSKNQSYVLMHSPQGEQCKPFIAIANQLREVGLMTPTIYHADVEQGLLLLSDFGNTTYLKALSSDNANQLYTQALNALAVLQTVRDVKNYDVPDFDAQWMRNEWQWHKDWFLHKYCGLNEIPMMVDASVETLINAAVSQPQVFMHRDYHAANLMVLPQRNPGILDFQDAFIGPLTYDLVSVLRDCYIDWPDKDVYSWVAYYWQILNKNNSYRADLTTFIRWFDLMGLQRHLKALFTFARKKIRDDQPHYLQHVPRVINYIIRCSAKYPELIMLHDFYKRQVQPLCVP